MKRTIAVRDAEEDGLPGAEDDGPEQKRVKEEAGDMDEVLELTGDDFECVICCGEAGREQVASLLHPHWDPLCQGQRPDTLATGWHMQQCCLVRSWVHVQSSRAHTSPAPPQTQADKHPIAACLLLPCSPHRPDGGPCGVPVWARLLPVLFGHGGARSAQPPRRTVLPGVQDGPGTHGRQPRAQ